MAINSLFNLDPSKFELGRGSGSFRRVVTSGRQPSIDLASVLAGLEPPAQFTAQAPGAFQGEAPGQFTGVAPNIPVQAPTFNTAVPHLAPPSQETLTSLQNWDTSVRGWLDTVKSLGSQYAVRGYPIASQQNDSFAYGQLNRGSDYFVQQRARDDLAQSEKLYFNNLINLTRTYEAQKAAMAPAFAEREAYNTQRIPAYKQEVDAYNAALGQFKTQVDKYMQDIEPYKGQITDYNKQLADYKSRIENYNTQVQDYMKGVDAYNQQAQEYSGKVDAYKKERASRIESTYASLIDPALVEGVSEGTRGEALAESSIYSDQLHQMMLDRISSQPIIDQVSTLFSGGNR